MGKNLECEYVHKLLVGVAITKIQKEISFCAEKSQKFIFQQIQIRFHGNQTQKMLNINIYLHSPHESIILKEKPIPITNTKFDKRK